MVLFGAITNHIESVMFHSVKIAHQTLHTFDYMCYIPWIPIIVFLP